MNIEAHIFSVPFMSSFFKLIPILGAPFYLFIPNSLAHKGSKVFSVWFALAMLSEKCWLSYYMLVLKMEQLLL